MKRLTKIQQEIEVLATRVPQLTDQQKEWARRNFNYYRVVKQGTRETRCPDCNRVIPIYDNPTRKKGSKWCKDDHTIVCPHCGAKIQIRTMPDYYKAGWNNHQEDFFQIMNVVGGWQVTRLVYMQRYCYVRKESTPWEYYEVCQAWNRPDQKKTYFRSFPKGMCMHHPLNPYKLNDYVPRKDENGNYVIRGKYYFEVDSVPCKLEPRKIGGHNYFDTTAICPDAKMLPAYRQRGCSMRIVGKVASKMRLSAMWLFESVSYPMYETLLKAGEWDLYRETAYDRRGTAESVFDAWKICRRNHYDIHANYTEWLDYVQMLIREKKDIRNPHFVCPADLHKAHNDMLEVIRRREAKEEERRRREQQERDRIAAEEAMKDALKAEAQFIKDHKRFFDICIPSDKGFTIIPLRTINDFKEEGLQLNHCVFRLGYYRKAESLILSARSADDKPIETIEVDLRSLSIRQCYGLDDTFTPLHKDIVSTMNANMWQVQQRMRAC